MRDRSRQSITSLSSELAHFPICAGFTDQPGRLSPGSCGPGQAQSPNRAAAIAAAAAARFGPTSGQFQERRTHNHCHRHEIGLEHISTSPRHLLPQVGLRGCEVSRGHSSSPGPPSLPAERDSLKPSVAWTESWCYSWPGQTGIRQRCQPVNFPGIDHRLHGRPVGREARGLLLFADWATNCRLRMLANPPSEYLGRTTMA